VSALSDPREAAVPMLQEVHRACLFFAALAQAGLENFSL